MAGHAECQMSNTVFAVVLQSQVGESCWAPDGGDPGRRQAGGEYHTHDPQRTQQSTQLTAPWEPEDLTSGDAACKAHSEEIIVNNITYSLSKALF